MLTYISEVAVPALLNVEQMVLHLARHLYERRLTADCATRPAVHHSACHKQRSGLHATVALISNEGNIGASPIA